MKEIKKVFKEKNIMFYLKVIAIFLIPSMYTVTYLAANVDPYTSMSNVPVGIVNNDKGYEIKDEEINIGKDVADGMIESNGFDFKEVSEEDFSYKDFFMKIKIPENFSESIVNFKKTDFAQAEITLEIDESKNYIFASIAQEALYEMQSETNNEIVKSYLDVFFNIGGISIDLLNEYNEKISDFIIEANSKIDTYQKEVSDVVFNLKETYTQTKFKNKEEIDKFLEKFKKDFTDLENKSEGTLISIDKSFDEVKESYENLKNKVLAVTNNKIIKEMFEKIDEEFLKIQNTLDQSLDSEVGNEIDNMLQKIDLLMTEDFNELKEKLDENLKTYYNEYLNFDKNIDEIQSDIVNNKYLYKKVSISGSIDNAINFFATPTEFKTKRENQVAGYGQGLAPFFISLSLYVGALIILTIFPLKELKEDIKGIDYKKNAVFFLILSLGQVIVLFLLLKYVNNLSFIHPLKFIIYSLGVSFFFVMLMFLLVTVLKDIGKFLAFILLVLQLGGSAGTFPIETSPKFFQIIHPFLPMTYTVDKFREIMFMDNVSITFHIIILSVISILMIVFLHFFTEKYETYK